MTKNPDNTPQISLPNGQIPLSSWDEIIVGQAVHQKTSPKTSAWQIHHEVQEEPQESFQPKLSRAFRNV